MLRYFSSAFGTTESHIQDILHLNLKEKTAFSALYLKCDIFNPVSVRENISQPGCFQSSLQTIIPFLFDVRTLKGIYEKQYF